MNISLLLKWLWRLFDQPTSQWSVLAQQLISSRNNEAPLAWNTHGSFFWKDVLKLRHIFSIATVTSVADGNSTLFWYGNWGRGHLHFFGDRDKPHNHTMTIAKVIENPNIALPRPWQVQVQEALVSLPIARTGTNRDELKWGWNSNGSFSVHSAYTMLIRAGKVLFEGFEIWKIKVPSTVKIFALLLFHNRILTQEALQKRNIPFQQDCIMCNQNLLETPSHLFCHCSYAVEVWTKAKRFFPTHISPSLNDVQSIIRHALSPRSGNTSFQVKTVISCTVLWGLWLERNNRLFRDEVRSVDSLLHWILMQHSFFINFS